MISTEMLIVMLVFLVYIGVWYVYMSNFMDAVEGAMRRLENSAYADETQHKVNALCANAGSLSMEFKSQVGISGGGNEISVNDVKRNVDCDVEIRTNGNSTSYKITKEEGKVVIE